MIYLSLRVPKWASQVVIVVKNLPASRRPKRCGFEPWVGKIPWRRARQLTPVFLPGEYLGQKSLVVHRVTKSPTQWKQLSMHSVLKI